MIKFGVSTFVWYSPFMTNCFGLLEKVAKMGYDIIEIAVEDKDLIDWKSLKKIADDLGLSITISGAFGEARDLSSENIAYRKNSFNYIVDCIQIAEKMGSPIFTGPVYSAVGKTRYTTLEVKKQENAWCVEGLYKLGEIAKNHGVIIGVEPLNRFETDMINTIDQALLLVNEISHPSIKISMDTFHNNIEEKNVPLAIRKIGKDLLCHIQGNENDRGTPGTGSVDWLGIKQALIDIDYEGAMVIETFGAPSAELAKAASIWRPLAESSDILAKDGLSFYKTMFR